MPRYDYGCSQGHVTTAFRLFSEREDPFVCACGSEAKPMFSPTSNIFLPISFRAVLSNGAPGGGQLSWSDFHDVSERELAKMPNVEKYQRVLSQPRNGLPPPEKGITMEEAYKEAKEMLGHG